MTVIDLRGEGFNVFRVQQTTGAVTGHAADTITDSAKSWTTDEWQNHAVRFTSGNHNGRSYSIASNTADTLTCTVPKGPAVPGENIGTGGGGTVGFSGTLADPVDTGTLSITDTVETFADQGNGTLAGNNGGSGTIDYDTGAWSVTFGAAPADGQAITADYDPLYNFNCDGGVANDNTFEIIDQGRDLTENTTPPGSADLPCRKLLVVAAISLRDEGFNIFQIGQGTGSVTGRTEDTITDSAKSWTPNEWHTYAIKFTSGNHNGRTYSIASNTADTLICVIPRGPSRVGENIGTGNGTTTGFSGTLTNPVTKGTLSITDGVETFTDNSDGTLTGDNGGSGTITYSTGAWSVTFGTAPADGQAITADYDPGENIGTGDASTVGFSGTLADPVNVGTLSITDGVETFTDNKDGTLAGNNGGSGTIIYETGAWSVTFGAAPANSQAITAEYDPLHNFNCDGGVAVADTFDIISPFSTSILNTTPPRRTDMSAVIDLRGEGFNVFRVQQTTGAVTGHAADTITDSSKSWTPDEWHTYAIKFTSGNHNTRSYSIISNTADTLTCTVPKGPAVSGENIGTGDGSTTDFSGTLADPVDTGTLSITDTIETFTDQGDGTLAGNNGGSGTIDYDTGAWSVTFGAAPLDGQAITADYDPLYNFNCDSGLAAADTFEIIEQGGDAVENTTPPGSEDLVDQAISTLLLVLDDRFYHCEDLVENTTPPGSEDLVDQAISTLVVLVRDKFYHCVCSTDRVFTPASITPSSPSSGGGNSSFPSIPGIGYKVVFTGGSLSGNSYTVQGETGSQGISVPGSVTVADVSNPYIIVPYATEPGADVDQAVNTLMTNSGRFYLWLDPTGGAVFTITSLTGEGVTVSGAGWTDDDWVEYWIEFVCTDPGGLTGESFLISSNTSDTIYSEGLNFSEAGAKVGDQFIIRGTFFILSEPPAMMPIGAIGVTAPPVYGPKHGRGVGLSVYPSARYGVFIAGGAAARGLK